MARRPKEVSMLKLRKKRLPENQHVQIKKNGRIIMPPVDKTVQSSLGASNE
jgi:hypothetical protein